MSSDLSPAFTALFNELEPTSENAYSLQNAYSQEHDYMPHSGFMVSDPEVPAIMSPAPIDLPPFKPVSFELRHSKTFRHIQ
jgi:hypothetical protein